MNPYFSICVPTYNRCARLKRLIQSLDEQTFKNFELLIIDDGSSDDTKEFISLLLNEKLEYKIKYFFQVNSGKYVALNRGIENAIGKFFLIVDSDDLLLKDALKNMYRLTKKYDSKYIGIIGKNREINSQKVIGKPFPKNEFVTSYIDFHFGSGFSITGNKYGDCFECVLTKVIQKYKFPENSGTKFIPESYIFDQIGLKYQMIAVNTIFGMKEYTNDGITNSYGDGFYKKNMVGFLYKYVNNIDYIFINSKVKFLPRFFSWVHYWKVKNYDYLNDGPSVKRLTFTGCLAWILFRPLFFVKNRL